MRQQAQKSELPCNTHVECKLQNTEISNWKKGQWLDGLPLGALAIEQK